MKTDHRTDPEILRQRAEELVSRRPAAAAAQISVSEATRLIHELEVHQAELELQNEELRHSWAEAEVAADKYVELYDFSPLGYMSLSEKGEIIELNLCASQMLEKDRTRLKHSQFSFYIAGESKPGFNQFLQKIFNHKINQTCEIILTNSTLTYLHLAGSLSETRGHCLLTMVDITGSRQAEISKI